MAKLPRLNGNEVVRALKRAGFVLERVRGSHHIFERDGHAKHVSVPIHGSEVLGVGLLAQIIDDAGLTKEQFEELLR